MFIDEESGTALTALRLSQMGITEAEAALVHYYPFAGITLEDTEALVAEVAEVCPAVVVFDSMADVLTSNDLDENSASDVTKWMVEIAVRIARSETQSAVLLLDHNPKNTEQGVKYARGSGAKKAKCDASWFVNKVVEFDAQTVGSVHLERTKNRPGFLPEQVTYVVGGENGRLIMERFDPSQHVVYASNLLDGKAIDALVEAGSSGLGNTQLQGILGVKETRVKQIMTRLEKAGSAARTGAGRTTRYIAIKPAVPVSNPAVPESPNPAVNPALSPSLKDGKRRISGWVPIRVVNDPPLKEGEW
jgi:hypothetical protein